MTDEMKEMADEAAEMGRTFTERVSVTGGELIETVQSLLREATVRRITIQDKDGRNLLEIPLYAGIAGALVLGSATVLALIAAWFAQVSILIERDKGHDGGPTVVGGVTAFFGTATRGAGDAARRMADALEARLGRATETTDAAAEMAGETADEVATKVSETAHDAAAKMSELADAAATKAGEVADMAATKAHDAAEALADAAPEHQCAAMTKAGTRCKRDGLDGSDYCTIHQIA